MNCNNFLFWFDILYLVVNNPYTHILGFWKKEEFYREVPTVHFKKQFLVVLELEQEGSFITYSTYQRYNQLQQQNIRIPLIQVGIWLLNLIDEFIYRYVNNFTKSRNQKFDFFKIDLYSFFVGFFLQFFCSGCHIFLK